MIGKLTGRVDEVAEDHAILDVGGVGYVVAASAPTLARLSRGEAVSLVIDTHVREDAIRLYGFASAEERAWFRLLQTVQGVGAKVALAVLSVCPGAELAGAIATGDKARVARAAGVGAKLAQRIVSELKDKVPALAILAPAAAPTTGRGAAPSGPAAEAVSALVNLGYAQVQAAEAVSAALAGLGGRAELDALIRGGLKELAR